MMDAGPNQISAQIALDKPQEREREREREIIIIIEFFIL